MPRVPKVPPLSPKKMKWLVTTRIEREDEFKKCQSKKTFWTTIYNDMRGIYKDALGNRTSDQLKTSYENTWKKYKNEKKRLDGTGAGGEIRYHLYHLFNEHYGERDCIAFAQHSFAVGDGSPSASLPNIGEDMDGPVDLSEDEDQRLDVEVAGESVTPTSSGKKPKKAQKRSTAGETVKLMAQSVLVMSDMQVSLKQIIEIEQKKMETAKLRFEKQYDVEVQFGDPSAEAE